ncbi:hypothetical protein EYR38_009113, partial [Pleurotus pulmonarius]
AALANQPNPIQYALCNWGNANIWDWGARVGHSWRMSSDSSPTWSYLTSIINTNVVRLSAVDFFAHNDMDMMEIGNGALTVEEQRTHFAAWVFLKSPILLGTDLSKLTSAQLDIIKNKELLAFHQDNTVGTPATPFTPFSGAPTTSPPEYYTGQSSKGSHVFIINTSGSAATKQFAFANVPGLPSGGTFKVHDMWTGQDLAGSYTISSTFSVSVAAHDTAAYFISGSTPGPASSSPVSSVPPTSTSTSRTSTSSVPITSVPPANPTSPSGTVPQWGQCGGIGYSGPTTCVAGTTCTYNNDSMEAKEIASNWLNTFADQVYSGNVDGVASCFHPDGWLRDILVFTWDNRSLEGHDKIKSYLRETLSKPGVREIKVDERPHLEPYSGPVTSAHQGVGFAFTFSTHIAHCRGYVRLIQAPNSAKWNAISVQTEMENLKGHEEEAYELGIYGGHTLTWGSVKQSRRENIERNPYILIIGGGQTGLIVAARFKQMNLSAIVIEKTARIGDVWRNRYPTLTLHTPRNQHQLLYQPYPTTWPRFTPKDKLADWMEQYAVSQDLVVWNNSQVFPHPIYEPDTKTWRIQVNRNGQIIDLNPAHIVVASGTLGAPRIPAFDGQADFKGATIHTVDFHGGGSFRDKKVVVVGAGNSAADICQDLVHHGAASVTMVQRSSTCVVTAESIHAVVDAKWPDGVPTDISDFKSESLPFGLVRKLLAHSEQKMWDDHKAMHEGLTKAGLKLNMGINGAGLYSLLHERLGGMDIGCAQLIIDGKVRIKQGVEIARTSSDSVHFTDGSTLEADVIVFATGYENIRETMRPLFGDETIDKTRPVYGKDEEGEFRGSYRPSGHPGLWFATGDFIYSRFYSKRLALELKAIQLGIV